MKAYEIILQQLGGKMFVMMTGAHRLVHEGYNILRLKFKGCRKFNSMAITLTPMDTYKVEFWRTVKFSWEKVGTDLTKNYVKFEDIYCDQLQSLFTQVTGLNTTL